MERGGQHSELRRRPAPRRRALLVGVFVAFVAVLAVGASAAGFFNRPDAVRTATHPNAEPSTTAPAAGGQRLQSASAAPSASPSASPTPGAGRTSTRPPAPPRTTGGKPTASNTGVPSGTVLVPFSGTMLVTTPGAVVDARDVSGSIEVRANNVTIQRTRVRCGTGDDCILVTPGVVGTLITDTELGGGANGVTYTGSGCGIVIGNNSANHATTTQINRVHIHHTIDGLRSDGNLTVLNSYIHQPDQGPGMHGDGSQSTGWSNMVFRNNVIVGGLNSAIYLNQEDPNPAIRSVVIDGNWLEGTQQNSADYTSFPLYVNDGVSGVTVTNNRFNRIGYAPAFDRRGSGITVWSNNTFEDTGEPIPRPASG